MPIFSASFTGVAVSVEQDLFEFLTHASSRIAVWSIALGQYSDAGDAAAEMLSISVLRGHTTPGAGGTALTPVNFEPLSGTAVTGVDRNNTTLATTGAATLLSDTFNIQAGWFWTPPKGNAPLIVAVSSSLVVRISAPADAITMSGTVIFEEYGSGGWPTP